MQLAHRVLSATSVARAAVSRSFPKPWDISSAATRANVNFPSTPQLYGNVGLRFKSTSPTPPAGGLTAPSLQPTTALTTLKHYRLVFYQLSKFRLSALVVSTACAGFVVGSDEEIEWSKLAWTALGTMMTASAANTYNQIFEVKNDSLMKRTMGRPLPSGRIGRAGALAFALSMTAGGVAVLSYKVNDLTAGLGAGNIALYALAYTPLKQVSVLNTWVGAVVGAIPPLMGWAAARGQLELPAGVLAAALYFWQLPHFFSLAWLCREDYAKGGYRMISLNDATGKRTATAAMRNAFYLLPIGLFAYSSDLTSMPFAAESVAVSAYMALRSVQFHRDPTNANARLLFRASLLHLPLFMAAMIFHRIPQPQPQTHMADAHNATSPANDTRQGRGPYSYHSNLNVPFPFLPLPELPPSFYSCPSRAIAEEKPDGPGSASPNRSQSADKISSK